MSRRTVGLIDGLVFLVFWSLVGMMASAYWWGALPIILFVLVPVSALVSWRGAVMASSFSEGSPSLKQYVLDGAKWGSLASLMFLGWSIASQVSAAGEHLEGASFFSKEVATYLLFMGVPLVLAGTVAGSVHGGVYFYLNRWLATANQSGQRTR